MLIGLVLQRLQQKNNLNLDDTIHVYTKVSIGIADAFISNWDEKYRSNLVRPETLINNYFDSEWKPILQTHLFLNIQVDIQ